MVHRSEVGRFSLADSIFFAAIMMIMGTTSSFAGTGDTADSKIKAAQSSFTDNAIKNLITGIESENVGLQKSSIYYAGFYEIDETVESLVKNLQIQKNADTRILIALALYKIGNEEGMKAVADLAEKDSSIKVRRMGKAILEHASFNNGQIISINE